MRAAQKTVSSPAPGHKWDLQIGRDFYVAGDVGKNQKNKPNNERATNRQTVEAIRQELTALELPTMDMHADNDAQP